VTVFIEEDFLIQHSVENELNEAKIFFIEFSIITFLQLSLKKNTNFLHPLQ
jgi:hypothetical protein